MDEQCKEMGVIPYSINKAGTFLLGKSWKTSVLGYLGCAVGAIIPFLQKGTVEIQDLVMPVVLALMGRFQKDADKTGA